MPSKNTPLPRTILFKPDKALERARWICILAEGLNILAVAKHIEAAIDQIIRLQPDVVLIDIDGHGLEALSIIDAFPRRNFQVILMAERPDYAFPALKRQVTDYLLKPISELDVRMAIHKVSGQSNGTYGRPDQETEGTDNTASCIVISDGRNHRVTDFTDIIGIYAEHHYSHILFADGAKLLSSQPLHHFETIAPLFFFRIHKSRLVNLHAVVTFNSPQRSKVTLNNGIQWSVAYRRRAAFVRAWKTVRI